MKKFITFLSVLCAFVCMVACSSSTSSPSGVVEQYAKYIKAGQYEKVTELFCFEGENSAKAEEMKKMMESGMLDKAKAEYDKEGGVDSYELGAETISEDGSSATVELTFIYGNGKTDSQKVETENYDGKWYLSTGK